MAISIPIFTAQLEKSREATDLANIRAAYSELTADALSGEEIKTSKTEGKITINPSTTDEGVTTYTADVTLVQKVSGWTTNPDTIGGMTSSGTPTVGKTAKITVKSDGSAATLTFNS